jgi:hypothetical protein
MNLMSTDLQVYVAKVEIVNRIERARSYNGSANHVPSRRSRPRRVPWRGHA